jgi:uncharacterized membrane protein YhfC
MIALKTGNAIVMVVFPIMVSAYLINRYKTNWKMWGIGGLIFIISQVGHIPFNSIASKLLNNTTMILLDQNQKIIFNALFLGLSAGIWEETSRYVGYRVWLKKPKAWIDGLTLGLGHGSFESILIGFLAIYVLIQMVGLKGVDLTNIVPLDRLEFTMNSIQQYWNANWFDSLLGSIERIFTLSLQILLSLLIVNIFKRRKIGFYFLAVIIHTAVDASAVLLISFTNVYLTETFIGVISFFSIIAIILLKDKGEKIELNNNDLPLLETGNTKVELDDSILDLEDTKYI